MFNNILVPLDGSELAERALPPALRLSQQAEGRLLLLRAAVPVDILMADPHIFGGYSVLWPDQALDRAHKESAAYLERLEKSDLGRQTRLVTRVIDGEVAEAIVATAADEGADLIVLSSHGYSGLTRWLLGSVAERVLSMAPCPVLVVRNPNEIRRVVIAVDGSTLSEQALAPGLNLAASLKADATLLRAVPRVNMDEVGYLEEVEHGLGRRLQEGLVQQAEDYLRALTREYAPAGLTPKFHVTFEPAAQAILHYVEVHETDLVVMSTHGRTGLQHFAYGSVTEKVLRGGHQNMLIIRPTRS